jgi:WhiB family redox-sensing transcriptional regulator
MSTEWKLKGACRDEDVELFFPDGEGREFTAQIADAKEICSWCPAAIRAQCLAWATDNVESGIWGGTTETERATIRRERRQAAVQAEAERWCSGCEEKHPLEAFPPRKRSLDGLATQCREYGNRRQVERRRDRRQQVAA